MKLKDLQKDKTTIIKRNEIRNNLQEFIKKSKPLPPPLLRWNSCCTSYHKSTRKEIPVSRRRIRCCRWWPAWKSMPPSTTARSHFPWRYWWIVSKSNSCNRHSCNYRDPGRRFLTPTRKSILYRYGPGIFQSIQSFIQSLICWNRSWLFIHLFNSRKLLTSFNQMQFVIESCQSIQ